MRKPTPPPRDWHRHLADLLRDNPSALMGRLAPGAGADSAGLADEYPSWDRLRRRQPPDGLTPERWWALVKFARSQGRRTVPLVDVRGVPFSYVMPDPVLRRLHAIDQQLGGRVGAHEPDALSDPATRDRYLFSSLAEEAITSSQIEGAATTRREAKDMLRRGRAPRDNSERMVLNNYRGMEMARELRAAPLTPQVVLDLHHVMTDGTLDPSRGGRQLRQDGDGVAVFDNATGELLHAPPPAGQIGARLEAMCAFANAGDGDGFVHPVVRAVLLHFWLAYDHPFVDGNGRTARALFYWSMMRSGYWLAEFVSISRVIHSARARYGRSFLDTETDDNDATYFLLAQLRVIEQATADLNAYLRDKARETRQTVSLLQSPAVRDHLNHRQIALLGHALRNPGAEYTVASHARSHGVTLQTARNDLDALAADGLLHRARRGRAFAFGPVTGLQERLARVPDRIAEVPDRTR